MTTIIVLLVLMLIINFLCMAFLASIFSTNNKILEIAKRKEGLRRV